jgi:hypothetical protein
MHQALDGDDDQASEFQYEYGGTKYDRLQFLTVKDILEDKREFHTPTKMVSRVSSPQGSLNPNHHTGGNRQPSGKKRPPRRAKAGAKGPVRGLNGRASPCGNCDTYIFINNYQPLFKLKSKSVPFRQFIGRGNGFIRSPISNVQRHIP